MSLSTRTRTHDRLAELVHELSGVGPDRARAAVDAAIARHGDDGDALLNVADALVSLRSTTRSGR